MNEKLEFQERETGGLWENLMDTRNIREIISLIRKKDAEGFELLYRYYFRCLFSVAYSVLNDEDVSQDVIQSVMLRLYGLDEKLFPSAHELSWLKTVVKNEALMKLRKEKNTVPVEEAPELPVLEQRIEDFIDMEQFHALTADLNERQRKVVAMKILGDMTHREIAEFLSIPVGTVQWIYNTSIRQLRRIMTGLSALTLALGGGLICQLIRRFRVEEMPGQMGIESIPAEPAGTVWLPVSIGLFLLALAAWIIFFKFSDRIPTKRLRRRI